MSKRNVYEIKVTMTGDREYVVSNLSWGNAQCTVEDIRDKLKEASDGSSFIDIGINWVSEYYLVQFKDIISVQLYRMKEHS